MSNVLNESLVKKLDDAAILPSKGSKYAAGLDLYAIKDYTIKPGETVMIGTGLAMAPPNGTFIAIAARSGLATKQGLAPANKLGIVDEDYRGEVKVALYNHSSETRTVKAGDRIAQAIVIPYFGIDFITEVDELPETERGDGGFGSTGK